MPCNRHITSSHQWYSDDSDGTKINPTETIKILACEKLCGWVGWFQEIGYVTRFLGRRLKNASLLRIHVRKVHGLAPIPTARGGPGTGKLSIYLGKMRLL
ncbi:hypothetical protein HYALB_00010509 [Hymenoscyphus albidus]|uniref:Uncharacterized protein n=1 Tax=Hymenoscyphus albidus TaxID=595503 RepID=A0A9N9Q3C8_9HELO|nr:hypothetical protein HYALB_00010509 [Hymenoscyphus albidus]